MNYDAENHQDDDEEGGAETAGLCTAKDHQEEDYDAKDHHQEDYDAKDHQEEDDVEQPEADNILDYAIEYKMKGAYPPGLTKDKKRAVRKRAQTICIEEGEVYILRKKNKVKLVTSVDDQNRILRSCHADATSGHFGVTKTWRRLAERFYWRGMYQDAKKLVTQCCQCQRMNKKLDIVHPELYPVPVKSPWYHIGMDFVGPISPTSSSGNRYILTISDYFTKFAWAKALPTKEAVNVVNSLKELFYVIGLPSVLTTDQGSEFNNKLNKELMAVFNINHRLTTAYHPQANGLDERFNQTLSNSLAKFAQVNRESWDEKLRAVVYAYNSSVQESTKHTPFEVMFGRTARLPVDINTEGIQDPDAKLRQYVKKLEPDREEIASKRRKMEEDVKANIEHAQSKQKEYYDKKFGAASCFGVGSEFFMKDFTRKKRQGGKLDFRWLGPYTVTSALGKGLFQLKEKNGSKVVKRVNGFHLKKCPEDLVNLDESKNQPPHQDPNESKGGEEQPGTEGGEEQPGTQGGEEQPGAEGGEEQPGTEDMDESQESIPPLPPPLPSLDELSRIRKVLNTGNGHWVAAASIGAPPCVVRIYDSLYSSAGTALESQIASVINTQQPSFSFEFMDVPVQSGTYDCGLFAIGFATAIAMGRRPEDLQFDQNRMRRHLWQCFEKRKMEMFPYIRERRSKKIKTKQIVDVYCVCRMPEMGESMVECSSCGGWYHISCVDVPQTVLDTSSIPWYCKNCS